jgi:CRISPR-associated protein Cmr4
VFKKALPFFLLAETSVHAGSGSDLGIVDLPIQRESHTEFPKIEASGLKGSIRESFSESLSSSAKTIQVQGKTVNHTNYKETLSLVFGPEDGDSHAGALGFIDARLLLFPVKSMKGIFAWITCPYILNKFKQELNLARIQLPDNTKGIASTQNIVPTGCSLLLSEKSIVLEEYTFEVSEDKSFSNFAEWLSKSIFPVHTTKGENDLYCFWREKMNKDVVLLSNDDFRDFVTLSTEVVARTKIDQSTGTVQNGALFYEEYLPQETVLYSLALATPLFTPEDKKGVFSQNQKKDKKEDPLQEEDLVLEFFRNGLNSVIQIGGNATIGKGLVKTTVMTPKTNNV